MGIFFLYRGCVRQTYFDLQRAPSDIRYLDLKMCQFQEMANSEIEASAHVTSANCARLEAYNDECLYKILIQGEMNCRPALSCVMNFFSTEILETRHWSKLLMRGRAIHVGRRAHTIAG